VKSEDIDNFIFTDGTGSAPDMTLPYGRSPEGKRVTGTRPVSQGRRIPTIGALSSEGSEVCMVSEGTPDGAVFLSYVSDFLCPVLKEGQVVITDNAGDHKVEGVKELIESEGAKLIYLPPYSPGLSPPEMCRSEVEQFLKKAGAGTEEALNNAVSEALNMITENDCKAKSESWRDFFEKTPFPSEDFMNDRVENRI